jgi:hypothetical protein
VIDPEADGCLTIATWWSVDTDSSKVHVAVLDEKGAPVPANSVSGETSGANGTVRVRLAHDLGGWRIQLTMDGWGLLDESYAVAVLPF